VKEADNMLFAPEFLAECSAAANTNNNKSTQRRRH